MARGKKAATTLTPEEKLQQALLPVDEQPYSLPSNWTWVKHNGILDISGGSQPAKFHFISEPAEGYTQLYQTRDYGEHPIPVYIPDKYATKTTDEGDILLARYGGSLGKVFRAHAGAYNVALAKVIKIYPTLIDDEYLYKYYLSHFYQDFCVKASSGRSAQAGFNREDMDEIPFPLPPIKEQKRIVDRIERIFAKLDEAKEKAQAIVDGFDLRKSAILHKAFTGELIGIKNGETTTLDTIVDCIRIGPFGSALHKEDYVSDGIPVINPKHISNQNIVADMNVSITEDKAEELSSYRLKKGDIVMGRRGEMGRSAPVSENEAGWLCGTGSLIIRLKEGYNSSFYSQIIASHFSVQYLEENCVGSTMKNLNEKVIKSLPVPNYTKEQQQRIVAILDSVLEKEQQAKDIAEAVIDQIDTMKKAVLARAFRGELGTNDPAEESAMELLRSVL